MTPRAGRGGGAEATAANGQHVSGGERSAWWRPCTGGCEIEMKLPGRFSLDAALRGALKTAPGVLYLEDA